MFRLIVGESAQRLALDMLADVDNLIAVPKSKLGRRAGRLDDEDNVRLNQTLMVFLGMAA
ncbi:MULTISPECIES: type II toxin-antitoxin system PemK/MazF family toxin [Bradyrhizobium]|uniref:type II toxin-antitoxin system PemK/MazF family toxin n=1 Tax=Bradyrhizobium neotropicale TaxID=1497615 RepID=UPI001FEEAAE4|nr:type II toxin-antitoxin system PemK/MazF family toxin [Bradyrhizobium sp. BRP22]